MEPLISILSVRAPEQGRCPYTNDGKIFLDHLLHPNRQHTEVSEVADPPRNSREKVHPLISSFSSLLNEGESELNSSAQQATPS